jgi:hypothetical protein
VFGIVHSIGLEHLRTQDYSGLLDGLAAGGEEDNDKDEDESHWKSFRKRWAMCSVCVNH